MKAKVLSLLVVAFLSLNVAFAAKPPANVKAEVVKEVGYPDFAIEEELEGDVYVSFTVKEDGKINVVEAHSTSTELKDYVTDKLETVKVDIFKTEANEKYNMKFTFNLL
jgi:hypothetical protein